MWVPQYSTLCWNPQTRFRSQQNSFILRVADSVLSQNNDKHVNMFRHGKHVTGSSKLIHVMLWSSTIWQIMIQDMIASVLWSQWKVFFMFCLKKHHDTCITCWRNRAPAQQPALTWVYLDLLRPRSASDLLLHKRLETVVFFRRLLCRGQDLRKIKQ